MQIERLIHAETETVEALNRLMQQLAPGCKPLTEEYLREILSLPHVFLFVGKEQGQMVGTFSLVLYKIPTGSKVSIEDVVVDSNSRGRKLGEQLVLFAIDYARTQCGADRIDLTSSPHRIAANALYRKLGFVQRDTHVYRWEVE